MKEHEHVVVGLQSYLTSALDAGEWLTSRAGALTQGKGPPHPLRRLGGLHSRSARFGEISYPCRESNHDSSVDFLKFGERNEGFASPIWKNDSGVNSALCFVIHTQVCSLYTILPKAWLQIMVYTTLRSQQTSISLTLSQSDMPGDTGQLLLHDQQKREVGLPDVLCAGCQRMN
jgi:hypothetical protein